MIKMDKTIWDVDFDDEQEIKLPLSNRQSIAILLGAGVRCQTKVHNCKYSYLL